MEKIIDYQILEWEESQFAEHCKSLIASGQTHIHKIKSLEGNEMFLVPQDFYVAAKECFKRAWRENK